MSKSKGILPPRMKWTAEQDEQLLDMYPRMKTERVAEAMGLRVKQINSRAHVLRLRKSREYLASEESGRMRAGHKGNSSSFKPGHKTWNAGLKGWQAGGRAEQTKFKPGQRRGRAAVLWRPIGHERLTKEGILQRKVADTGNTPRDYRSVHGLVWEQAHGPIPPGHVVVFKAGRHTSVAAEITEDRLELVSRRELMLRNSRHTRYPVELNKLIQLKGALNRKINNRTKKDKAA